MTVLPRLAVGTVQSAAESQLATWGLLALLAKASCQVQHFFGSSTLNRWPVARGITGVASRHLDSWLMSRETCQEVFAHGIGESDFGLVEGKYDASHHASSTPAAPPHSSLDTLSGWLDLPRLAVVDVSLLKNCQLPQRPAHLDGIILDRCADAREYFTLQTWLQAAWGTPVIGGLTMLEPLRAALARTPWGAPPSNALLAQLGTELEQFADLGKFLKLAARRAFPVPAKQLFRDASMHQPTRGRTFNVAVAFDRALNCYFPDTFDLLELRGASIAVFSPLRDEQLPVDTDLVYLGCGHPELYARELANNQCMISALRRFIHGGGHVYAEGGGMAYLAEHLITPAGEQMPMVGALPVTMQFKADVAPVEPVELAMPRGNWLAQAGEPLRGYRNPNWLVQPGCAAGQDLRPDARSHDLVSSYQVVGSRIQLNFATQPALIDRLLQSTRPRAKAALGIGSYW